MAWEMKVWLSMNHTSIEMIVVCTLECSVHRLRETL